MTTTNLTRYTSDLCSGYNTTLSPPFELTPHGGYVAVGPVFNFFPAASDCCGIEGQVQNYNGGPAPNECYYFCNIWDLDRARLNHHMTCMRSVVEERNRIVRAATNGTSYSSRVIGDFQSPAQSVVYGDSTLGVWRCAILGLASFGVVTGSL